MAAAGLPCIASPTWAGRAEVMGSVNFCIEVLSLGRRGWCLAGGWPLCPRPCPTAAGSQSGMALEHARNGAQGHTHPLAPGLVGSGDPEKSECDLRFNRDVTPGRGTSGGQARPREGLQEGVTREWGPEG